MISLYKSIRHCLTQSLAGQLQSLDIRREKNRRKHFRKISFEIENSNILWFRETKYFSRKIHSENFSHSLSFFGFGLFGKHNSAHAVMTSSRLHFTLDKTALTCLHSNTQAHAHCIQLLQSESHALSPSAWTSVRRRQEVHLRALCALCAEYTHAQ